MKKGAIIYISSNREHPYFESRVIQDMYEKSNGLDIYSVTQKPMNLGTNKVVGDVGTSGFNFCRQLQMVVEMAQADYVISVESDCLYSPDYFTFVPDHLDRVYRNTKNYVIPHDKDYYLYKKSQTAFQVAGRDFLLARLNYLMEGQPEWDTEKKNWPKEKGVPFLDGWDTFETEFACLTIKTGDGMRKHTNTDKKPIKSLPYWGAATDIIDKYLWN